MKSCELNKLLVESFPILKEVYFEEVEWQEGHDTGSHTVYGDVFTPYIIECIEKGRKKEMPFVFSYIEKLLTLEDPYADEVVALSVIGSIAYLFEGEQNLHNSLGEKSKSIMNGFLQENSVISQNKPRNAAIEGGDYSIETISGQNNLIHNVSRQVNQRANHLPQGTRQTIRVDVRGQTLTRAQENAIRKRILQKCNVDVEIIFKRR